ncbi:hypothetical protein BJY52DRAFT_1222720 [Lactarius psammicola]|nr:hypothetical protein BJY52DRAFT_1222720 [Lactarius psammicola]
MRQYPKHRRIVGPVSGTISYKGKHVYLPSRRETLPDIPDLKNRQLPTQLDTLALVERIVNTGINCLTVDCRMRNMRPRECALVHHFKMVIDFVKGLGGDVAAIEDDSNTDLVPRVWFKYLDYHWTLTKFCIPQFKGRKSINKVLRNTISKAKGYADLEALVQDWIYDDKFAADKPTIDTARPYYPSLPPRQTHHLLAAATQVIRRDGAPPQTGENPYPAVVHDAPLLLTNEYRALVPADVLKQDQGTPTTLILSPRPEPALAPNAPLPVMQI